MGLSRPMALSPTARGSEGEPPGSCSCLSGSWPPGSTAPLISSPWRPTLPSAPCSSEVRNLGRPGPHLGVERGGRCRCLLRGPSPGLLSAGAPGRGSSPASPVYSSSDKVACHLTHTVPCAHQKPITALKAAAGRLVTGSQDHTLRVRVGTISWARGGPARVRGIWGQSGRERLEVSWMNCGREFLTKV